jgi:choline monooxygenase
MELHTTLPVRWYTDPGVFEKERWPIFGSNWIHVAYEHQLRRPGDYVTENLAGWPIFVRRNDDGQLAGFFNLCPHRAGPIVFEGEGCQANLVCRYHGWAFRQDGSLLNPRDFGGDPGAIDLDLKKIQVESFRGMVWVCLDPATKPLLEWLGEFPGELADVPLETYRFHSRSVRTLHCNWKTYADNFLEGYHLPTTHPAMARDADAMKYEVRYKGDDERWNTHVMPPRHEDSTFSNFGWFWPTFAYDIFPHGFAVERWLPRGYDKCDLFFEYFFGEDAEDVEGIIKFSEEVADEDARMCEHVQRNLDGGAYVAGVLSPKWEYPLASFQRMVQHAVGEID